MASEGGVGRHQEASDGNECDRNQNTCQPLPQTAALGRGTGNEGFVPAQLPAPIVIKGNHKLQSVQTMTLSPRSYRYSDRSERTDTPNLRPMTAKAHGSHSRPTRGSSVADPECIRLDLCRWENEGGALIETESARSATVSCAANKNFPMDSQTVQQTNLASRNNRLTGRSAWEAPHRVAWSRREHLLDTPQPRASQSAGHQSLHHVLYKRSRPAAH